MASSFVLRALRNQWLLHNPNTVVVGVSEIGGGGRLKRQRAFAISVMGGKRSATKSLASAVGGCRRVSISERFSFVPFFCRQKKGTTCKSRLSDSVFRDERGYTLLETVVAMALFVSVLIPLGTTIGNFMLDNSADQIREALHIAESELTSVVPEQAGVGTTTHLQDKFIIERTIQKHNRLVRVKVSVASTRKPGKKLVTLQKSFMVTE